MIKSGRVHLPLFFVMVITANQSGIRKAYLVSVLSKKPGKKRPFVLQ